MGPCQRGKRTRYNERRITALEFSLRLSQDAHACSRSGTDKGSLLSWELKDDDTAKSNTLNHIPGTDSTEHVVSCMISGGA